jgi:hypothetical protein
MIALARWLGIARWGRALTLLATLAAASAATGFWAGVQWQDGRVAQQTLRSERQAARSAEEAAAAHVASTERIHRQFRETDSELAALLGARPELWDCDIGDDGLRLIQRWDQIGTARGAQTPLPDAAAGTGERRRAGPARQSP